MKYLVNTAYGSKIYIKDQIIIYHSSNLSYVKRLCYQHMFSYEGYLKAVKFNLGYQKLIPIYLNANLILIPTMRVRDFDNIWINYAKIKHIINYHSKIEIVFIDNTKILVNISYNKFIKRIKILNNIKKHLESYGLV